MLQCDKCYAILPEDVAEEHCYCGARIDDHCHEIECAECHVSLHLSDGCEWPQQRLYCWNCAHAKLKEASDLLLRIDDAYDKPDWSNREDANQVMDAINDWLGDNQVPARTAPFRRHP